MKEGSAKIPTRSMKKPVSRKPNDTFLRQGIFNEQDPKAYLSRTKQMLRYQTKPKKKVTSFNVASRCG